MAPSGPSILVFEPGLHVLRICSGHPLSEAFFWSRGHVHPPMLVPRSCSLSPVSHHCGIPIQIALSPLPGISEPFSHRQVTTHENKTYRETSRLNRPHLARTPAAPHAVSLLPSAHGFCLLGHLSCQSSSYHILISLRKKKGLRKHVFFLHRHRMEEHKAPPPIPGALTRGLPCVHICTRAQERGRDRGEKVRSTVTHLETQT